MERNVNVAWRSTYLRRMKRNDELGSSKNLSICTKRGFTSCIQIVNSGRTIKGNSAITTSENFSKLVREIVVSILLPNCLILLNNA
jgi:hypothetical protein